MAQPKDSLVVLWTSGDPEVAKKMVFMYTLNAKKQGWWDDVTLIIWGPSSKLLTEDMELQATVRDMHDAGITLESCKHCADLYGITEKLETMGIIDITYMGQPLTDYLKKGYHVVTF